MMDLPLAPTLAFFQPDGAAPLGEPPWIDWPTGLLLLSILLLHVVAFIIGRILKRQPENSVDPAVVRVFTRRVTAWLMMYSILALGILLGRIVTVVLFGLVSFWALREFITMTPTRRGDHRALFWTFFFFTPLQYVLVGIGRSYAGEKIGDGIDFYGLYSIMIPVYASLFIPARIALAGDHKRFLERTAKIQAGLLICVYALSYAPALLDLDLMTWSDQTQTYEPWEGSKPGLLLYFIFVVQLADVFQLTWDRLLGRHVIARSIHGSKTWEGFFGCCLSTSVAGALLWLTGVTPFTLYGSALMSLVIAVMAFAGMMTMSAIKRDRGVSDYGTLVQGHAGVLDRIDSMCFAAPVFFHITRYFLFVIR